MRKIPFYIAASWETRYNTRIYARDLERLSRASDHPFELTCMSRWLEGDPMGDQSKAANVDLMDIDRSDILILRTDPKVSPGKFTEMGYALARSKPVIIFGGNRTESVFFHHYKVKIVPEDVEEEECVAAILNVVSQLIEHGVV